jgi:hypothetical protein
VTALYTTDDGTPITTHSMLKCFNRCPKQAQYKYAERLKRKLANERDRPLRRGTWMHKLLEEHYAGRDWKVAHRKLSNQFGELFDEERDALGDLPRECAILMRSYLWHYGANKEDRFHGWNIHHTEVTLECPWPDDDGIYRCRVDLMVEDEFGLWLVDHKTHRSLPDITFRLLDYQSALYIWCAWENGFPVRGFIWNYVKTKSPTHPSLAYAGTPRERLSTASIDTDWPTYYLGVKALGRLDDPVAKAKLAQLKSQRWQPGAVQTSPFFRRDVLEKSDDMIARVVGSAMRTRDAMHAYDFGKRTERGDNYIRETVERNVDRSCGWCSYKDLCATELFGGNPNLMRRQLFRVGDPMDYYQDDKEDNDSTSG